MPGITKNPRIITKAHALPLANHSGMIVGVSVEITKPNNCNKAQKQFSESKRIQTILEKLYEGIHIPSQQNVAFTYGEILFESIEKCLSYYPLKKDDIFLDVGSGLGKVVIQVTLQTQLKAAYGIEIIPELHDQAVLIQKKINNNKINFICADFLTIAWPTSTYLLIGSPCFDLRTLDQLASRIETMKDIRTVLSLRPLLLLKRLSLQRIMRLECSWDSALCYIYS